MGLSSNQASTHLQCPDQASLQHSGSSSEFSTKRKSQNHQESKKLKCPRCDSTNTKFCYYNNYNKSQPRHFCKSCRRYWTEGGTLRNVPIGGGRKNKRFKPPATTRRPAAKAATRANNILPSSYGCINGEIGGSNAAMMSLPDQNSTHDHELQFPFPISGPGYVSDLYGCSNGESSGLDASLSLSLLNDQPWTYMENTNTSWVWDDIDKFVSSDVTIPWDDAEIN